MDVACVNSNTPPCAVALWNLQKLRQTQQLASWASCLNLGTKKNNQGRHHLLRAVSPSCFCNPSNEPILEQALKEPVAFVGGMFAGLLRLDLNEDPLKEWITRTVEASGLAQEIADVESSQLEEVPVEIEIELTFCFLMYDRSILSVIHYIGQIPLQKYKILSCKVLKGCIRHNADPIKYSCVKEFFTCGNKKFLLLVGGLNMNPT